MGHFEDEAYVAGIAVNLVMSKTHAPNEEIILCERSDLAIQIIVLPDEVLLRSDNVVIAQLQRINRKIMGVTKSVKNNEID